MTDRRNKASASYRAPRTEEARRVYAPAGRAARVRRSLQRIAQTVAATVTAALTSAGSAIASAMAATAAVAQTIMPKTVAAVRCAAMAAVIFVAVSLAGCRSVDEMDMADVPVRNWHHGVELKVTPSDTETLYDLDLLVRYNHNFTVDTLTLWFRTQSNDTLIYTERCRFELPMSRRPAAIRPVVGLPWRCGVRFSIPQPRRIRITPLQPVRGIEAVGIRLRPVTPTSVTPTSVTPTSVTPTQEE